MANNSFTTYDTTPSLGATNLAYMMGAGIVIGFGGLEGQGQTQPKLRRSLLGWLHDLITFRSRGS